MYAFFFFYMSYIIATWKDGLPYGVTACYQTKSFKLIPLDSDVALNQVFSHPYRAGAASILSWIQANEKSLSDQEFSIQDEGRFRK